MKHIVAMLLSLSCCVGIITGAQAAIIVTAVESGGNVIFSGSGTLNIEDLRNFGTQPFSPSGFIFSSTGLVRLGPGSVELDIIGIDELTLPSMGFGTGVLAEADSSSGDTFGISQPAPAPSALVVPAGYTSGTPLAGTLTFLTTDFATLGLTPGSYVWSWGAGANADSLTLNITTVPTPSALLLFGSGLVALIGWNYRKSKQS